jgi:two-component system response regulator (stage 0 sporulation protein F)
MRGVREMNPPAPDAETGRRTSKTAGAHLLLAEDDADLRTLLQHHLGEHGFEVTTACDGIELFRILANSLSGHSPAATFAVVVADLHMPGWDALGVLSLLGYDSRTPPVVLITAFGSDEVHRQAKWLGAAATLDKPFDLDDLCALVDRLAERRICCAGRAGTA